MSALNALLQQLAPLLSPLPLWVWASSVLLLLLLVWNRGRARRRFRQMQIELDRIRNEMRAMTTAAVGVGGKVREIERQQRQLKQQPPLAIAPVKPVFTEKAKPEKTLPQSSPTVVNFRPIADDYAAHPYDYAIQLARHGASVSEIIYQSGISHHEAKLIHMLHAVGKSA
ncbi:MAG: DUF2802 domain-containing protein [Gammaproteobacteria bacterium]|nr:DUF2802 domain-containing protein [Gammaproteobacteria bacterium]